MGRSYFPYYPVRLGEIDLFWLPLERFVVVDFHLILAQFSFGRGFSFYFWVHHH